MRLRAHLAPALTAIFVLLATAASSIGASSNVNVTLTVASSSYVDATGCASSDPGRTAFGAQLGPAAVTTSLDCVVEFGSGVESSLRLYQGDGGGDAMRAQPAAGVVAARLGVLGLCDG